MKNFWGWASLILVILNYGFLTFLLIVKQITIWEFIGSFAFLRSIELQYRIMKIEKKYKGCAAIKMVRTK